MTEQARKYRDQQSQSQARWFDFDPLETCSLESYKGIHPDVERFQWVGAEGQAVNKLLIS